MLFTDHKPLSQILHPEKSLPVLCISSMANYANYHAHLNYDVVFKNLKTMVMLITAREYHPRSIQSGTQFHFRGKRQRILTILILLQSIKYSSYLSDLKPLHEKQGRTSTLAGLSSFWKEDIGFKALEMKYSSSRQLLDVRTPSSCPPALRDAILNDLHTAHLHIIKMKGMACSFVFWQGIDSDMEKIAKIVQHVQSMVTHRPSLAATAGNTRRHHRSESILITQVQ